MAHPVLLPKDELGVVRREGRVVIQDLERLDEPPVVLTGSAEEIWSLLDGRSVGEIVDALVAVHEVDAAQIRADVVAFLRDLQGRDIVRAVGSPA